jgi:methylated-DNA-protein-cysteine methyltransferase-like protein
MGLANYQKDEYYQRVWKLVRQVPPGKVVSYGQLAELLEPPLEVAEETYRAFGSRWVGQAMRGCPADVPWQRVINAQGRISLPGPAGAEQRQLLEEEGVEFSDNGRVDFKRFGWMAARGGYPATKDQPQLPGLN